MLLTACMQMLATPGFPWLLVSVICSVFSIPSLPVCVSLGEGKCVVSSPFFFFLKCCQLVCFFKTIMFCFVFWDKARCKASLALLASCSWQCSCLSFSSSGTGSLLLSGEFKLFIFRVIIELYVSIIVVFQAD